jgi:hypothetical protein
MGLVLIELMGIFPDNSRQLLAINAGQDKSL